MNTETTRILVPLKTVIYAGDEIIAENDDHDVWLHVFLKTATVMAKKKIGPGGMATP